MCFFVNKLFEEGCDLNMVKIGVLMKFIFIVIVIIVVGMII